MTQKKQNSELMPISDIEEVVTNVIQHNEANNKYKYYLYRFFGLPIGMAAKMAGIGKKYAYQLNHQLKTDPKIQGFLERLLVKFPDHYRSLCKARLIEIAEIEGKVLAEYQQDPKLAIKNPKLLRDMKVSAGAIQDEFMPKVETTINIANLHKIMDRLETDQEFFDAFLEQGIRSGAINVIKNGEKQPSPDANENDG